MSKNCSRTNLIDVGLELVENMIDWGLHSGILLLVFQMEKCRTLGLDSTSEAEAACGRFQRGRNTFGLDLDVVFFRQNCFVAIVER